MRIRCHRVFDPLLTQGAGVFKDWHCESFLYNSNMSRVIAYFITWTTYGSWLPGDARGWIDRHEHQIHTADLQREANARERMQDKQVLLNARLRTLVEETIQEVCTYKEWKLRGIAVQSNHIHVILSASEINPTEILRTLKAYCSRALNQHTHQTKSKSWWTRSGSIRYLSHNHSLQRALEYVENQR